MEGLVRRFFFSGGFEVSSSSESIQRGAKGCFIDMPDDEKGVRRFGGFVVKG